MRKVFGILIATLLIVILFGQVSYVSANSNHQENNFHQDQQNDNDNDRDDNRPITSPITSPITGPLCKPGFGFGDKNHCHFGPPGNFEKLFHLEDLFVKLFHLNH